VERDHAVQIVANDANRLSAALVERVPADDQRMGRLRDRHPKGCTALCHPTQHLELDTAGAKLLSGLHGPRGAPGDRGYLERAFGKWPKIFTDQPLCAAIMDRLTSNGHIIEPATTPTGWPKPARAAA
jgi:hypothetical protein